MKGFLRWFDALPLGVILIPALFLGLAPFVPEPHLVEKIRMLANGELNRPIDAFDLIMHGALPLALVVKLARQWKGASAADK